ncbi:hypothetical protein AVEN_76803-1 [Araneus ventricosus]|uniref:Uncharacterized protein n=1 Tax=Araneus ventricosus TaxID=182803 RepID=A0A4Y2WXD4_ARAVE|nr:hypothetical protein AVEN_76803-1 [Araneus ventricosus]
MENFSNELKYRVVMLKDEGSIVLTSFVVQKSLSYLDLQLSEHILALRREHFVGTYCHSSFFLINFFSTEESLRNSLEPKRRLLYTLHLDVPQGKEYSNFRNGPASSTVHESFESLHLVVSINNCFYSSVLSRLVETAFDRANEKFTLLKLLVDLDEGEDPRGLREDIGYFYLNHLYRECINSNFVVKCLRKIIYLTDLLKMEQPKLLEYFLYHACKSDFDLIKILRWRESIANICIRESCFRSLQSVLKYEDKSCYSENSYNYYGSSVWNDRYLFHLS